jgi:hypothetical protein
VGADARHKARHDVPGLQKADTATEVCSLDSRAALAFGDRFAGTTSANFEAARAVVFAPPFPIYNS